MTTVNFKGNPVHLLGTPPSVGQTMPDFTLVKSDLSTVSLNDFADKEVLLNIYPSVDTGTCFKAVQHFDKLASERPDLAVVCISMDLPFASARVAGNESFTHVMFLSDFRDHSFGKATGLIMKDGPLAGLFARTVIILDKDHKVKYIQLVSEITEGPDYKKAEEFFN
jgi:thiol peroxidase